MSIIDKLSSGMTEAGNTITQKAKDISEQSRISGEIAKNKSRRQEYIAKLGEAYYQAQKKGEPGDFEELIHEIDLVDGILANLTDSLYQLKGIVICEQCGTEVPKGSIFCSSCGAQVRQPNFVKCSKCGAELPLGTRFCVQCGTRIEE